MLRNTIKLLIFIFLLSDVLIAQNYEIKLDSLNASGWFGGDNRPEQQRNVAVAQSVLIEQPINLESFAFYFTSPFDSAINGTGTGHEVTLKLQIRDSVGTILQAEQIVVPDTFTGGWVIWSNINLTISETGKYIFSTYLIGGYDSNLVNTGQGCDLNAGYLPGERYAKYVTNDADAEFWGDWSLHTWDSDFWLTGTLLPSNVKENNEIPGIFSLEQNYPNPFNPTTKIKYTILSEGTSVMNFVQLKVFDVLGNEVAILVNEEKPSGKYEINFDAFSFPSGVYFYQLIVANEFLSTKKMTLIK